MIDKIKHENYNNAGLMLKEVSEALNPPGLQSIFFLHK